MKFSRLITNASSLLLAMGIFTVLVAQTAPVKPSVAAGEVISIDAAKIVLQTKDGSVDVILSDKTQYMRVPPENPVIKAAVPSSFSDIGKGDKLMVTGILSGDKRSLPAKSVYLMTSSDIAQRNAKESEKWTTRGISGRVAAVDQTTKQIRVDVRGLANTTSVVLTPKDGAKMLRYAPNSVKFSEARSSSLTDVQPGDMLRALGDRSPDGASFQAEEIITGAFRTVAGTVKTVDVAKNELVITDIQSKKDITVALGSASVLKNFPKELAQRMAAAQGGQPGAGRPGGGPPAGGPPAGGAPSAAGTPPANGNAQGGPGRGGPGGGRGIDDMLDRFDNITAADLKVGDVIAVSSTKTDTLDRITAIKLLAGVEPFLRVAQAQAASGGQRGQGSLSLDIPGLDGFGGP